MLLVLLVAWGSSDQSMLINATMDIKPAAHIPIFRMRTCLLLNHLSKIVKFKLLEPRWIWWAYGAPSDRGQSQLPFESDSSPAQWIKVWPDFLLSSAQQCSANMTPFFTALPILHPLLHHREATALLLLFHQMHVKLFIIMCVQLWYVNVTIWKHLITRISYPAKEKVAQ